MATEDTTAQRSKPLRSRKDNVLPAKRRKVSHSTPHAPLERPVNSLTDSSDDEDDKPLVHRRAFIQRILKTHESQVAAPPAPTDTPSTAAQRDHDSGTENQQQPNGIENNQSENTRIEHMGSLEERGEGKEE